MASTAVLSESLSLRASKRPISTDSRPKDGIRGAEETEVSGPRREATSRKGRLVRATRVAANREVEGPSATSETGQTCQEIETIAISF